MWRGKAAVPWKYLQGHNLAASASETKDLFNFVRIQIFIHGEKQSQDITHMGRDLVFVSSFL